jgi:hypothetical protein
MAEAHYKKLRRLRPNFPLLSLDTMEDDVTAAREMVKRRFGNGIKG